MIVKKYEFENESIVDNLIDNLGFELDEEGNKIPTHKNAIVKIGFFMETPPVFDADGNETTPGVLYDKFCVDVLWRDSIRPIDEETGIEGSLPYDNWAEYEIIIQDEGVHQFMGVKYITD